MKRKSMPSLDCLREKVSYDPSTGLFTSNTCEPNRPKGSIVGSKSAAGYVHFRVGGIRYLAHRLAWYYIYGEEPDVIDHINQRKDDNRISNLRNTNKSGNEKNRPLRSDNTTGANGVYWNKPTNKWRVLAKIGGRMKHIGYFGCYAKAVAARLEFDSMNGFTANHGIEKELPQ